MRRLLLDRAVVHFAEELPLTNEGAPRARKVCPILCWRADSKSETRDPGENRVLPTAG